MNQTSAQALANSLPIFLFLLLVGAGICACAEVLHKMGYSRWLVLLVAPTGFLGMVVFAFLEWPIERELAWLKLKTGAPPGRLVDLVEAHAVALEKRGDWKQAARVYRELIRKAISDESGTYYRNCLSRLEELAGESLDEWEAE
jgi:hypothetical protein